MIASHFVFKRKNEYLKISIRKDRSIFNIIATIFVVIVSLLIPFFFIVIDADPKIDSKTFSELFLLLGLPLILIQYFLVTRPFINEIRNNTFLIVYQDKIEAYKQINKKLVQSIPFNECSGIVLARKNQFPIYSFADNTFDQFGYKIDENEVKLFMQEGSVMIISQGESIRFGSGLASWDAQEFINEIEKYTGRILKVKKN